MAIPLSQVACTSANADCDNGAAVSHQCGDRWWSNGGYGIVGRRRCPEARQEEEWRTPRTRDMHQGESLCTLSTCCDGASVLRGHWRHASPLQTQDYTGCRMRTSENSPSTHSGE